MFDTLPGLDDEDAWLTIMAWGGQQRGSGRSSWSDRARWAPIVRDLRSGAIDAREAYSRFSAARIKGTGPAYFTKVIFFLQQGEPEARGYIMDQWTAKSMELLHAADPAAPAVHWDGREQKTRRDGSLNWQAIVSRRNDTEVYDRFCRFVNQLAETLNYDSDHIEEAMFAGPRTSWRKHTMAHWAPPPRKAR